MGFKAAIIVGIIGFIIAFLLDLLPVEAFLKIVPICWFPSIDCNEWYYTLKTYIMLILLVIILWFIPI